MNEYVKKRIKTIVSAVLVVLFLLLTMYGQKTVGYPYLALMLAGLAGILALLYLYNRSYNKPPRDAGPDGNSKNKN